MIPELGHFALALAAALALAQAVLPLIGAARRDQRLLAAAPALAEGQFLALLLAFGALEWSSIVSDFSVLNIAENSQSTKPLLYKITGVWGNHEGSILLWCFILSICGAAVGFFGRSLPAPLRARVIAVLGATSVGFLLFSLTVSDPFQRLWPPPMEGRGMNPLLEDPGLAFHPPILYAGYVGFAIPFAFAVAALIEGRVDAAWGRWVRPWALAAWAFLTGGIALGSWWSYYVLGWGGYWFWDPVENASLLPWLAGTALVHSAIVVEKREALKVWTILLAIGTFSLSLCGTFLVRSGILNSVHAFANDPARGVFILALLGLIIGTATLLFLWRAPRLAPVGLFAPVSREAALVLNNVFLCAIATVVFLGTVYPLFAELLLHLQLSVGAPFFNVTVLPLAVPLLLLMPVGPLLSWKRAALWPAIRGLWWAALAAAVIGGIAVLGRAGVAALGFALGAYVLLGAFAELVARSGLFRMPLAEAWPRLRALRRGMYAAAIAHAGLGLTVLGITGMTLAETRILVLHPGEEVRFGGYVWHFDRLETVSGPNYTARQAVLSVRSAHGEVARLLPAERFYTLQRTKTVETAIHTNLLYDLYAVLGEERDGGAVFRLHVNPLAPWIWLGALVMAAGGGLSLFDRRLRVGAPARRVVREPLSKAAV
jgi:cytochrome c-type biogenesis protein CcmF